MSEENKKDISPEAAAVAVNRPGKESPKAAPEDSSVKPLKEEPIKEQPKAAPKEASPAGKPVAPSPEKKKAPAGPAAPQQIGKEAPKKKSGANFLISLLLGLAALFILFVVLLVLMIARGGEQNPILVAFGVEPAGLKTFLLGIINLSFGSLAMFFFVLAIIGIFRMLFAKKEDRDTRKKGLVMMLIGFVPMMIVMMIWLFLFNFINQLKIGAERVKAEILITQPADLKTLQAPLEVTFSSANVIKSLQNSNLNVKSVAWDFDGNGLFETPATDFEMSYLYNNRGNYKVGLQVLVEGEEIPREYFYPLQIGEAVFDAKPSSGTAPLEIQFDAANLLPKDKKVTTLDWDFDEDGVYDTVGKDALRPRHIFEKIGKFNVHLRILDENNVVQNFYREIEITQSETPLLVAEIEASPGLIGPVPFQVRFDGGKSVSAKGKVVNYDWDFGDGSSLQSGRSVTHVYNNSGVYNVTLTVKDDTGRTAEVTAQAEAKGASSPPTAQIKTVPAVSEKGEVTGEAPLKVMFDASLSTDPDRDIVDYEWKFGADSAAQTGQKADYTYEKAGKYTVTLTVRDTEKQENSATITVRVQERGVSAVITATPEEGTAPLIVNFDGSTSNAVSGKIVSFQWDFGDGSPKSITGAKITHKFAEIGSYTVHLKVTTNENQTAETQKVIYVREIPLRACFTPSRRNGAAPLSITFDPKCSSGSIGKYQWDFGDGAVSDSRKPAHTFEQPGTYNVTLEVADDKNNINTYSDVIVAEGEVQ